MKVEKNASCKIERDLMSNTTVNELMALEDGSLCSKKVIYLYQKMVNDGTVWKMPGFYGRCAVNFIENGLVCKRGATMKEMESCRENIDDSCYNECESCKDKCDEYRKDDGKKSENDPESEI
jgi:hypothetical protein